MSLTDLATAIATSDVKSLSRIKGLGKKTAERIVLELREKISADEDGVLISPVGATNTVLSSEDEDAVIALTELGFSSADSRKAVQKAKEAGAKTAQEVISAALRSM